MVRKIKIWLKLHWQKIVNSIAFYPAFIATLFLVLSILAINFDYSDSGKQLKEHLHWLSLKDASTARSIVTAITAGIISLTVFSFSMVMIVLNQAASQLSNRTLDNLIGNRFQQLVLGIYIGTIVFALFLLTTIRDINSGIYIPALSTYLLILITVFDIFLFIYFLHYVTQSVKYQVIIERIYRQTKESMSGNCCLKEAESPEAELAAAFTVKTPVAGIFVGFDTESLLLFCKKSDCAVTFIYPVGTFLLRDTPFIRVNKPLDPKTVDELLAAILLESSETIGDNYYYGMQQLTEVAVKALSPGINDPATAVLCLRGLFELLSFRAVHYPANYIKDDYKCTRIILNNPTFEDVFTRTVLPIWDYGKGDRLLQNELLTLLHQLINATDNSKLSQLIHEVKYQQQQFTMVDN